MSCEERSIRQGSIVGNLENLTSIGYEVLRDRALVDLGFEARGEQKAKIIVEGDQSAVKSSIMQAGEGEAVPYV